MIVQLPDGPPFFYNGDVPLHDYEERPKYALGAMLPGHWHGNTSHMAKAPLPADILQKGSCPETMQPPLHSQHRPTHTHK